MAQKDLQAALSSGTANPLLLQGKVFPADPKFGNLSGLLNVTGDGVFGEYDLSALGDGYENVFLGDPGNGFPPWLYPNLTYSANPDGTTSVAYEGSPVYSNSTIIIGPEMLNSTAALHSITVAINNNTSNTETLGYLTIVADSRLFYQIIDSPEGLQRTGQVLLIGPITDDNLFSTQIRDRGLAASDAANFTVRYQLPPLSNSTLGNRHRERAWNGGNTYETFPLGQYPAVLEAWKTDNEAIDNAGALLKTMDEEGEKISVGYARLSTNLVDWIVIFEQALGETYSPINELRRIVLACKCNFHSSCDKILTRLGVFGTIGLIMIIVLPLAHVSVLPIRALQGATSKSVQPYQFDGQDGYGDMNGQEKSERSFTKVLPWKQGQRRKSLAQIYTNDSNGQRIFQIPEKVPEKKHVVNDELTDLTHTFNAMSEELVIQYDRLEDRVRERTAELEMSKKAAEAANDSKTLFIANISHELKTPLNGILGMCAVSMQEDDVKKIRQSLDVIYKSGDLLLHLLNDLLTFSKNSIGQQLSIDEREFRLVDIATQITSIFDKQGQEAQVSLKVVYQGTHDALGLSGQAVFVICVFGATRIGSCKYS